MNDKQRLDFIEAAMLERMVSVEGWQAVPLAIPIGTTDADNAYPIAIVHFNGIGRVGSCATIRGAIDDAIVITHSQGRTVSSLDETKEEERLQLLEDKERLDFLETLMMDRTVSLSGTCTTKQAQPHGYAFVQLDRLGMLPSGSTFREAIDNARAALQPT